MKETAKSQATFVVVAAIARSLLNLMMDKKWEGIEKLPAGGSSPLIPASSPVTASMMASVAAVSVALSRGRSANALRSTGSPTTTWDVLRGNRWNRFA